MHGCKLHEYKGPHDISEKTHRHVQRRATERQHRMENMNTLTFQMSGDITRQEHDQLLKDIEPPWSWIHQFATENCRDKSYNFLELQSIATDETPPESSDESFDFENNRFHSIPEQPDQQSCSMDERSAMEDMLLFDGENDETKVTMYSAHDVVNASGLISDIIDIVQLAVLNRQIDLQNTASLRSFLSSKSVPKLEGLDLKAVQLAIRNADEAKVVFKDFHELEAYLRKEMLLPDSKLTIIEVPSPMTSAEELRSKPTSQSGAKDLDTDRRASRKTPLQSSLLMHTPKPLESQFDDCQIEIDEKVLNKEVPEKMIIGLIDTPPDTPIIIQTPPRTPTPTPPSPHDTSSGIITANVSLHDFPPVHEPLAFLPPPPPPKPLPFECRVPALPGIGPAVTKETIRNVITYLKGRSRNEHGWVYPRHFREPKCPNVVEAYEG